MLPHTKQFVGTLFCFSSQLWFVSYAGGALCFKDCSWFNLEQATAKSLSDVFQTSGCTENLLRGFKGIPTCASALQSPVLRWMFVAWPSVVSISPGLNPWSESWENGSVVCAVPFVSRAPTLTLPCQGLVLLWTVWYTSLSIFFFLFFFFSSWTSCQVYNWATCG